MDGESFLSLLEDILLEANCLPPGVIHSKPNGNEGQGVSALQLGPQRKAEKRLQLGAGVEEPRPAWRIQIEGEFVRFSFSLMDKYRSFQITSTVLR